ncbi:MAG: glycosyltransferase [Bacteroidaceae bacterium]|nr:glycosyltransferase [Bacteroidaceae bacterium]
MQQELVSIIMPTFNAAQHVADSIESILAQTYQNWELLLIDDCSSDHTQQILEDYACRDARIRVFMQEGNMGAGHTRNKGIENARGRYIAFCDSDDRWLPEKLELQIAFMQQNNYAFTFTSYYTCDEDGNTNGIILAPERLTLFQLKCDDKIGFLTAIYDTVHCPKFLMPLQRKRQDYAYVLMIQQQVGDSYALRQPLAIYRQRSNSISHNKWSLVKYNAAVYRHVFGYSIFQSYAFLFIFFLPTYFIKRITNSFNRRRLRSQWEGYILKSPNL